MTPRKPTVAVIGDGACGPQDPRNALAEQTGRSLIDAGYRLMTGGLGGIMEAA
ncbi:MAG: TIGR00725 family protein, partial [Polyangiaceae bacterium]|nr:TIGR00725 family protein [Polyangiaceae bacterium]